MLQTISGLIFQIDLPKSSLDDEVLLMKIAGTGEVEAIKTFLTSRLTLNWPPKMVNDQSTVGGDPLLLRSAAD